MVGETTPSSSKYTASPGDSISDKFVRPVNAPEDSITTVKIIVKGSGSLAFDASEYNIKKTGTATIKTTATSNGTTVKNPEITWTSDDDEIATVSGGKITGVSEGTSWKRDGQATKYVVQYSQSKKFKGKSTKTVTITNNKIGKTVLKGLTGKKNYYVRVRSCKAVNGRKIWSSWSSRSSKVKVK